MGECGEGVTSRSSGCFSTASWLWVSPSPHLFTQQALLGKWTWRHAAFRARLVLLGLVTLRVVALLSDRLAAARLSPFMTWNS